VPKRNASKERPSKIEALSNLRDVDIVNGIASRELQEHNRSGRACILEHPKVSKTASHGFLSVCWRNGTGDERRNLENREQ
jgi:hypothetical protein